MTSPTRSTPYWKSGLNKEGVQQAKEASEIFERLGDTGNQVGCLLTLALPLYPDRRLDAAEETAFHAIELLLAPSAL